MSLLSGRTELSKVRPDVLSKARPQPTALKYDFDVCCHAGGAFAASALQGILPDVRPSARAVHGIVRCFRGLPVPNALRGPSKAYTDACSVDAPPTRRVLRGQSCGRRTPRSVPQGASAEMPRPSWPSEVNAALQPLLNKSLHEATATCNPSTTDKR